MDIDNYKGRWADIFYFYRLKYKIIAITIRLMTWLDYIHTYIHTYMHTCTSLPSPVLSASMRDGVVVVGAYL